MIFKKHYRKIEFQNDCTLEELCEEMNGLYKTKLTCRISDRRIIVRKKLFADLLSFEHGLIGVEFMRAVSDETYEEQEELTFTIQMASLFKIETYVLSFFFTLIGVMALFSGEGEFGLISILGAFVIQGGVTAIGNIGAKNFLKVWDCYIGTKV